MLQFLRHTLVVDYDVNFFVYCHNYYINFIDWAGVLHI